MPHAERYGRFILPLDLRLVNESPIMMSNIIWEIVKSGRIKRYTLLENFGIPIRM
jgi:hypothetical protein